jgi:uncharacterized protein YdhG (YjbR/CyaY superfamily)
MYNKKYTSIDEYIAGFPEDIQDKLEKLRQVIHKAAPEAQEVISYSIPAFKQNGILVYFAAFNDHIGFFPTSSGVAAFTKELAAYDTSKGTVRFPLDRPIPYAVVKKIVKFRVQENLSKRKK